MEDGTDAEFFINMEDAIHSSELSSPLGAHHPLSSIPHLNELRANPCPVMCMSATHALQAMLPPTRWQHR